MRRFCSFASYLCVCVCVYQKRLNLCSLTVGKERNVSHGILEGVLVDGTMDLLALCKAWMSHRTSSSKL